MKHPQLITKVQHSESKDAWNVVGIVPGCKYKIARCPYNVMEGGDYAEQNNTTEKWDALQHANFISYCFNNPDKVQLL